MTFLQFYEGYTVTNHTISERIFQTLSLTQDTVQCAMCSEQAPRPEMSVGPYGANGNLSFICSRHLLNSRQLINLLADYIVDQRQHCLKREDFNLIEGASPDAWFLY